MMMNFLEIIFLLMLYNSLYITKNIKGFLENLTDNFLNFVVNLNFFGDLKFDITKHYPEILLQVSLK